MKRLIGYCMVTLFVLCCLSCGGLVWLPDSRGFLLVREDGTLIHYDVTRQAERVIVQYDWLQYNEFEAPMPAVDPDGTRVALVHLKASTAPTVQILIYSLGRTLLHDSVGCTCFGCAREYPLDATLVHDSGELPINITKGTNQTSKEMQDKPAVPVFSWFTPGGERIIFCEARPEAPIWSYQPESKKLKSYDVFLAEDLVQSGLSPCTPDGKGFLALKKPRSLHGHDMRNLVFVDWDGWMHDLKLDSSAEQILAKRREDGFWPLGTWTGMMAEIETPEGRLRINFKKRTIEFQADAQAKRLWEQVLRKDVTIFPLSREVFFLVKKEQAEGASADSSSASSSRVELVVSAEGKVRPLLTDIGPSCWFYPSPDRQYVVIHYLLEGNHRWTLFDLRGEALKTW